MALTVRVASSSLPRASAWFRLILKEKFQQGFEILGWTWLVTQLPQRWERPVNGGGVSYITSR